jgi:hypothetical protein
MNIKRLKNFSGYILIGVVCFTYSISQLFYQYTGQDFTLIGGHIDSPVKYTPSRGKGSLTIHLKEYPDFYFKSSDRSFVREHHLLNQLIYPGDHIKQGD